MKMKPIKDKENKTSVVEEKEIRLKRVLSVWDSTAFLVGTIIGSGIFISPKGVLLQTQSAGMALVTWAVTGLISLCISLCYAELALTFPSAGSDYTYLREAYGEIPSFLLIFVIFLIRNNASKAILSLTFSTYFCQIFFIGCSPPELLKKLIASLALGLIVFLQSISSKWAVKLGDFFTAAKLTGLAVIIVAGFWHLGRGHNDNLTFLFENSSDSPGSYALAFYAAYWAYGGVQNCCNVIEEMKEPVIRNIIYSITFSQIIIAVVYLLTNFSYIIALYPSEILASDAVAMTFGDKVLPGLSWLMPFFVACSTFGSMSNGFMSSSRMALAASRNKHFPEFFNLLSIHYLTPIPILIIAMLISICLLFSSRVYDLILYTSYIGILGMTGSISGLIFMRIRRPELRRPLKLPLIIPVGTMVIMLMLLFFPFYQRPIPTLICFGVISSSLPIYFLLVRTKTKPEWLLRLIQQTTHLIQKLVLAMPEDIAENEVEAETNKGQENPAFIEDEQLKKD